MDKQEVYPLSLCALFKMTFAYTLRISSFSCSLQPRALRRAEEFNLLIINRQSEDGAGPEVPVVTVVVVDTAVRGVEVPGIVGVVVSARTLLLAYVRIIS